MWWSLWRLGQFQRLQFTLLLFLHPVLLLVREQWERSEQRWRFSPHSKTPLVRSGFGCVVYA